MAKITLYNQTGTSLGDLEVDASLFDVTPDKALMHEVVVAQGANSRVVYAHTKDRGEVAGTGKKPWKQKGTGRARHGSRRSPIWVGGGVTFGPQSNRNYSVKINRKARRKALAMALTAKVRESAMLAIDAFEPKEGKTKAAFSILQSLPCKSKKTLVVFAPKQGVAARSVRNIDRVTPISAASVNIVDVLSHECVLATKEAIDLLTKTYKTAEKAS